MFLTMKYAEGIGLAAPQIGIPKRFFVLDLDIICDKNIRDAFSFKHIIQEDNIGVAINPVITKKKGLCMHEEGCLSIASPPIAIHRYESIEFICLTVAETEIEIAATDLFGYLVQHEIDHLNGILINDK